MLSAITAPILIPSKFGLVASAPEDTQGVDNGVERWVNGFTWTPEKCTGGGSFPVTRPVDYSEEKETDFVNDQSQYQPFIVWAGQADSPVLNRDKDRKALAQRLLASCESKQMEAELMYGAITQDLELDNAYLTDDSTEMLDATDNVVDELAALEDARANCHCGGQSMIHVTPGDAIRLFAARAIERSGPYLITATGSIVVPGAGYLGDEAANPGMYATNTVYIKRGAVDLMNSDDPRVGVNRQNNEWDVIAERPVAAFYDPCCAFGITIGD